MALRRMNGQIDIRQVLSAIRVPTLVVHRSGDQDSSVEEGRFLAARIPGARFVELPGVDHLPWVGDQDAILEEVEEFLTGVRHSSEPDRVLATMLFTDIVGATERAAEFGRPALGGASSRSITRSSASSSSASGAARSTLRGTDSSRRSMGQREPSAAPAPLATPCEYSVSASARDSIPESAR